MGDLSFLRSYSFSEEGLQLLHQTQFECELSSAEIVTSAEGSSVIWLGFADGQVKLIRREETVWSEAVSLLIPWDRDPDRRSKPSGPVVMSTLRLVSADHSCLTTLAWISGHISVGWLESQSNLFRTVYNVVTPDTLFNVCSNEAFVTVTAHNGFTYIFSFDETNGLIRTKAYSFSSSLVLGDDAVKLCSSGVTQFEIITALIDI